jgi:hypothetical protein
MALNGNTDQILYAGECAWPSRGSKLSFRLWAASPSNPCSVPTDTRIPLSRMEAYLALPYSCNHFQANTRQQAFSFLTLGVFTFKARKLASFRWVPRQEGRGLTFKARKFLLYRWVPRQEVRDLARQSVGDTGLLDYVLKGLGGKKMGGYVFRREVNQVGFTACLGAAVNRFTALITRLVRKGRAPGYGKGRQSVGELQLLDNVLKGLVGNKMGFLFARGMLTR